MPKSVAPALDGENGSEVAMLLDGNEGGGYAAHTHSTVRPSEGCNDNIMSPAEPVTLLL